MLDKSLVIRLLLQRLKPAETMYLHIDTRVQGVVVPPKFLGHESVRFDIQQQVNDWNLDQGGFFARLGFNTIFTWCSFPFESITSVATAEFGTMWAPEAGNGLAGCPPSGAKPTRYPHLFVIEGGRQDPEPEEFLLPSG